MVNFRDDYGLNDRGSIACRGSTFLHSVRIGSVTHPKRTGDDFLMGEDTVA
jgi:hypothetical protein